MPHLTPELVLAAYRTGLFPMGDESDEVCWFTADPRCIFEPRHFHVPRSVRQALRRKQFDVRIDTAFDEVVTACANRPEGTWICHSIMAVYRTLHSQGHAHSVEAWKDNQLAGGLYGVAIGGAFFGESMFFRVPNASKVALAVLLDRLWARGFTLLDTQARTPHLTQFRPIDVSRRAYLARLRHAIRLPCRFLDA